jgi:hypothetical protein
MVLTKSILNEVVVPSKYRHSIVSDGAASNVTIAILKWGTKYGAEYVNGIVNGIRQHAAPEVQYSIVCFTDDLSESACLRADVEYR